MISHEGKEPSPLRTVFGFLPTTKGLIAFVSSSSLVKWFKLFYPNTFGILKKCYLVCLTTVWTMLLLLSHFSRVRLCATPQTAAHQAPLSLGFSRQEHWSGLPFPSPVHESDKGNEVVQSCLTLCDPIDGSPPGSPVPGILEARTLEWIAISFSNVSKWSRSVMSDS